MKKLRAVLCLLLVASACGGSPESAAPSTTTATPTTTTATPTTTTATPSTTTATPTTTTATPPTTTATPPTTTAISSPTGTEPLQIWEEVYTEIRRIATERPRRGQNITLLNAPEFSQQHLEVVTDAYTEASGFWSGAFDFPETLLLVPVHETNKEWWEIEMSPLEGDRFNPRWFATCNDSAITGMVEVDEAGVPHIVSCTGSEINFELSGRDVITQLVAYHETTHWYQYLALGSNTERCLQIGDPSCPHTYLPCWLTEGHAELYMKPFADQIKGNTVPSKAWREIRLATISNSIPDAPSLNSQEWLDYLWLPRTTLEPPCIGAGSTLSYPLGLPVTEILFYDFGDEKINDWFLTTGTYPSSATCPSWFNAFEDVFGVSVDNWYRTSAVPYLLETFSSTYSAETTLTFDTSEPPPYCQPNQIDSIGTDTTITEVESELDAQISANIPNNIVAACGWFDSQQQAQDWLEINQDFSEGVDSNGDGSACSDGDFGGATDCNGKAPELVLPQFCDQY